MSKFSDILNKEALNILVVRPDRLGDVILSTPVLEALYKKYPNAKINFLVRQYVMPLFQNHPFIDQLLIYEKLYKNGLFGFLKFVYELRKNRFDIAIVLQSQWKIDLAIFLSRIPIRIGPLSKIYSYFFYNYGKRQKRSRVEMHEVDYNLQLLNILGIQNHNLNTRVHIEKSVLNLASNWLIEKGWNKENPLVVVHPGMGGSALNWPEKYYIELIQKLIEKKIQVLITGGEGEVQLLERIKSRIGNSALFFQATPNHLVDFLGGLFYFSNVVVAPSTGPLHLAVALEKPVISFYPPIRVQSVKRWGPWTSHAKVFSPEVPCGQIFHCLGKACAYFPCMDTLEVDAVVNQVDQYISKEWVKT